MNRFEKFTRRSLLIAFAVSIIGCLASPASAGDPIPANGVAIALYRTDVDVVGTPWLVTIISRLDFVPGVTDVVVTRPDGQQITLGGGSDPNERSASLPFPALADMRAATDGVWTITISGSSPSTSTFTIVTQDLADADFFGVPQITSPVNGTTVPANTNLTWTDPTRAETAEAIAIDVNSDNASQCVDSLAGPITVDSVMWDPPELFEVNELNVAGLVYLRYGDAGTVSPYTVTSGSIRWSDASLTPPGYPSQTPRYNFGSATVTAFFATESKDITGDVTGDGVVDINDLFMILGSWGPCPNCPADLDGDGEVGLLDLLIVLGNWS